MLWEKGLKDSVYNVFAILILVFIAQCVWNIDNKSITADEFSHHVANGYSYLSGDFRMNPASPPIPRMLSGLPFIFSGFKLSGYNWDNGNSTEFAKDFWEHVGVDSVALSRIPILLLSVILGISIFIFSYALFGEVGGLASLILYVFCPDIIAHSSLATADIAVSLFFFLTLVCVYGFIKLKWHIAWIGVAMGLAFASKFSAILLPLIVLFILLANGYRKDYRKWFIIPVVALMVIWASYLFEIKPLLTNTPDPVKKEEMYRQFGGEPGVWFAKNVPVPLSTFSSSLVSMIVTRSNGTNAYLLGEWSRYGWWYYYFVAFILKNTIPFVMLSLLGMYVAWRNWRGNKTASLILISPVAIFFLVTLGDKAQAGIRYFLPIYPLLIIMAGGFCASSWRSKWRYLIILLLAWHMFEGIRSTPNQLAYFSQLVDKDRGYLYLRDSNLDWGQELKNLGKQYPGEELSLLTLTMVPPEWYGIDNLRMEDDEYITPRNKLYAIGAHFMDSVQWTKSTKPTKVIGHSLYVYDMR